jgi:hypothetical protein
MNNSRGNVNATNSILAFSKPSEVNAPTENYSRVPKNTGSNTLRNVKK